MATLEEREKRAINKAIEKREKTRREQRDISEKLVEKFCNDMFEIHPRFKGLTICAIENKSISRKSIYSQKISGMIVENKNYKDEGDKE